MRVRVSVLALLMAVLPALVFAYPGFGGGRGLLRVQNALVEDEAGLTISAHALGRNAIFNSPTNIYQEGYKGWVLDLIAPELSYAPVVNKYFGVEVFGSWGGVFQTPTRPNSNKFTMGTHDLKAGGKVSIPIVPVLKVGFTSSYTFMSGRNDTNEVWWLDKYALPQAGDPNLPPGVARSKLSWTGLVTLQLQDVLATAPNLMFNYGKINEETRYGMGVELAGRAFALFGEFLSRQPPGSKGMFDLSKTGTGGHIYITPGVVFGNVSDVAVKAAYSFAMGDHSNNELIGGIIIGTGFGARPKAEYGTITGTVTDEKTGAALAANVGFPENPKMADIATQASSGVFKARKVPVGSVTVEASADGYQKQTVPIAVENNKVSEYAFKLRPLKTYGTIAGTVLNAVTSAPMAARIEFPGSQIQSTNSDASAGAFKVARVETGVYTVTASADKYIKATVTLAVEDGKLAVATFKLTPAAGAVTVTGKVYDKKTNAPLSATVAFNDAVVTTDPATGVYKAQLNPGSYTVVVESKDYVKQTAALIIEKDKPLVRDFAMLKVGMSITLRGIYFDFDKSTIKPESRPALEDAAKMLNENPTINVEIQGHTDSKGSDSYNLSLSDRRAASVVAYLTQNLGIDRSRLTSRGYGESQPIATNDTDAGRALNRRVEFMILGEK
ncbi:MAG: OmpA family protein [candidate division WOR-3 bacterium]|nr:OmpA family protein [candidate division WOR-3 bacterium]